MSSSTKGRKQKIIVFQQNGSGKLKIEGLRKYGADRFELQIYDIDAELPPVIDDTSAYLPAELEGDLVLDYLRHNDLSDDLATLCRNMEIPLIGSGKKIVGKGVLTPPTCCGLARHDGLGAYGESFGTPEFEVEIEGDTIVAVRVVRGAPCGATWDAAQRLIGHPVADAARKISLEIQYFCFADPSNWDPIYGKSPLHFAGNTHDRQLQKAIDKALEARKK